MKRATTLLLVLLWATTSATVAAEERAADAKRPGYLGLMFTYHPPSEQSKAFMTVQSLAPGGPAERAGLKPGDLIIELDGQPFAFVSTYGMLLHWAEFTPGKPIELTVLRERKRQTMEMITTEMTASMYERWKANLALAREEHERKKSQ